MTVDRLERIEQELELIKQRSAQELESIRQRNAFYLSTQSLPAIKTWWIRTMYHR